MLVGWALGISGKLNRSEEELLKKQLAYMFAQSMGSLFGENCKAQQSREELSDNESESGETACNECDNMDDPPRFKNGAFSRLSEEMYLSILEHLNDVDLQELKNVNRRFYRLSRDPLLWKRLYERHSKTLKRKLLNRPQRKELILQNILRSHHSISASLLPIQETLLRKLRASQLIRQVSQRSNPIDLERQRILVDPVHVCYSNLSPNQAKDRAL